MHALSSKVKMLKKNAEIKWAEKIIKIVTNVRTK